MKTARGIFFYAVGLGMRSGFLEKRLQRAAEGKFIVEL